MKRILYAASALFMRMAKYMPAGPPPMMLIFMLASSTAN